MDASMDKGHGMQSAAHQSRRLTYDDFVRFPDDGLRHEIIDGVHYVTPSPLVRHQVVVGRFYFAIEAHLRAHPGTGQVFLSPLDVVLSQYDIVEPDLLFVASDRHDILTTKNLQGAPSLVIEVLSKHTKSRDRRLKRDLYERTGVQEYWLVDPEKAEVSIYRQEAPARFGDVGTLDRSRLLQTSLLPGLSLPLAELFD
jgi:Uma2 family endonuclease